MEIKSRFTFNFLAEKFSASGFNLLIDSKKMPYARTSDFFL